MKRKILVEVEIDWENYEDVSDELIIDDAINLPFEGVTIKIVDNNIPSKIYDILVAYGQANEDSREDFINYYNTDGSEWRFSGNLGFGGKYRKETNKVDYYIEDKTEEREKITELINKALAELNELFTPNNNFTNEEVFKLTHDAINIGMTLRQNQLSGYSGESGNEVHQEWFDKNVKKRT